MGGRGDRSKNFNDNKVISNIDVARNKPFRDARLKEIEAERAAKTKEAQSKPIKKPRNKERLIEKGTDVRILAGFTKGKFTLYPGQTGPNGMGSWEDVPKYETVRSVAGVGRMQLTHGISRGMYTLTDAKSGYAILQNLSKKQGIEYLKASVKKDGTLSKTVERHFSAEIKGERHKTAKAAFDKLSDRIERGGLTVEQYYANKRTWRK